MGNNKGFMLPLAVLLVFTLGISGAAFMHLDFLERRMAMNEVDNHGAFYLGSAGIERARETFKVATGTVPSWSPILNPSDGYRDNEYPPDLTFPPDLCPLGPAAGCLIPPFQTTIASNPTTGNPFIAATGAPVGPPDFPMADIFSGAPAGMVLYDVRAFNDVPPLGPSTETALTDANGILIFRAVGFVQGERKLLEMKALAISGLNLINCQGNPIDICPEVASGNPPISNLDGHDPETQPDLPDLQFPLATPPNLDPMLNNYYRFDLVPTNFTQYSPGPVLTVHTCLTDIDCTAASGKVQLDVANDSFYFIDKPGAEVTVDFTGGSVRDRVVIFALGGSTGIVDVNAQSDKTFTNAIIIGQGEIQLKHGTVRAPLPMPAVIAEGDVTSGNSDTFVFGTIFATADPIPSGLVNVNPVKVHGVIIGDEVEVQGSSTYSDDSNLGYYAPMPGFTYPPNLLTTVSTGPGSWKEIE